MLKYIWLENEMKVTASDRTVVWTAYDYGKYRCSWEIHYNNRRSNTKCNMRQYKSENEITYYSLIHYILSTTQWTNKLWIKYHAIMKLIIIKLMS